MSDPILDAPPPAPQPTDSVSVFNTKAFAFFGWFETFTTQMNAAIAWISGKSGAAEASALAAANSATAAATSATAANASKVSAAASETAAQAYAQAAGAAAGVPPPLAETVFQADADGNVYWGPLAPDASKLDKINGLATALGFTYLDKGTIAAGGTAAISVTQASVQRVQAAGNLTLTIADWATDGRSEDLELHCVNFGGKTITWPAGNWMKSDGSLVPAVGNSGVVWQTTGTDRVIVMRDADQLVYKVMR